MRGAGRCGPPCTHAHTRAHLAHTRARAQVMDYGYPQFTEAQILSEFIKTDAYAMEARARWAPICC